MAKERELTVKAKEALDFLSAQEEGKSFTVAEMKELNFETNGSTLRALVNAGLVKAEEVEIEVPRMVKTKVKTYTLIKND